jgi:hypothetical protein
MEREQYLSELRLWANTHESPDEPLLYIGNQNYSAIVDQLYSSVF